MSLFNFRSEGRAEARINQLEHSIVDLEAKRDDIIDAHARERNALAAELDASRAKLAETERKAKHADEDMRHLVKIKESQLDLAYQQKSLELERKKEAEIASVKDQYRDKLEAQLKAEIDRIGKMYGEILARLPNVNVKLSGDIGK